MVLSDLILKIIINGHNVFEINKENGFDLSKNGWTIGIPKMNFEMVVP